MKELLLVITLVVLVAAFVVDKAFAANQPPSCQEQLTETTIQAYNLDKDRDTKEQQIAKVQAINAMLSQRVQLLEKQLVDAKKVIEPVEKKAE